MYGETVWEATWTVIGPEDNADMNRENKIHTGRVFLTSCVYSIMGQWWMSEAACWLEEWRFNVSDTHRTLMCSVGVTHIEPHWREQVLWYFWDLMTEELLCLAPRTLERQESQHPLCALLITGMRNLEFNLCYQLDETIWNVLFFLWNWFIWPN